MSLCAFAQTDTQPPINEPDYNKPRLFNNLPDIIPVKIENFTPLFTAAIGAAVDLGLEASGQIRIDGQVVSTVSKFNDKLQSVVIRSTNFNGAGLTISKITKEDGTTIYRGRIISLKHGDLYELQKEGDNYVLIKKNFYDLINE